MKIHEEPYRFSYASLEQIRREKKERDMERQKMKEVADKIYDDFLKKFDVNLSDAIRNDIEKERKITGRGVWHVASAIARVLAKHGFSQDIIEEEKERLIAKFSSK